MIKVLELFGGIGACSKALERLGIDYEIADYVEIDKYAVKSFNAMHNTNFEPQDITTWDKNIEVDLIMHGSPCQDFSLAGLQAGGDKDSGTRSSLMYETIRIVEKLKPKYVIWENVKNLLSKKHRHNFDSYLEIMESLGYKNYYQVLNAKDYGIPQNRERVFTISIRNDINKEFIFPPKQELKLKLKDMLEDNVDEKYYLSDKMINYCMGVNQKESKFPRKERFLQSLDMTNNREIATTISTNAGNRPVDNFVIDSRNMKEKLCDKLIEENKVKEYDVIRHSYSNSRMKEWETRNIEKNNEVPTLDTRCDCLGVVQNMRIRKLTPKECWRLMGFDDEDFNKASQVNSNSQLYKQAGNSIVVNVLETILKKLL
jgi:DNA (cytosine-5)-methyltransferase 1